MEKKIITTSMRQHNILHKTLLTAVVTIVMIAGMIHSSKPEEEPQVKVKAETVTPTMTAGAGTVLEEIHIEKTEYESFQSIEFSPDESYWLAKIAMAEAEGEDTEGKALVMLTILNRVKNDRFPDTIEEVIFQEGQFTPARNGRLDRVEPSEDCAAALVLVTTGWDESRGALYFERKTDKDTWHSRNLEELFDHGNHTFYKERENQ